MWKGPKEDGITQSLLNNFLQCPYSFYLYAILGLEEETETSPNLPWGDVFHKGLEHFIPTGDFPHACEELTEYCQKHYPRYVHFLPSIKKMLRIFRRGPYTEGDWQTEQIIDQVITIPAPESSPSSSSTVPIRLRGKKDAYTTNHPDYGRALGEHKCKGYIDPAQLSEEIGEDTQCNLYMVTDTLFGAGPCEWVVYDLIRIPDTQKYKPAEKATESYEEWVERIYSGPVASYGGAYPIYTNKHLWIHQGTHFLPEESQEAVWTRTLLPSIQRLVMWYDYVTDPSFDFEDPKYNHIFYKHPVRHFNGRKTNSFKCDYHGFLTGQLSLDDLVPARPLFSELTE